MTYFSTFAVAATLLFCAGSAEAKDYIVKKGDTYANIARKFYGEPVFGPRGTINLIYRLNPDAQKSTTLEPGTKVILSDEGKAVVAAPISAPKKKGRTAVAVVPKHAPPGEGPLPDEAVLPPHVSKAEQEARDTKKLAELPDPHGAPPVIAEVPVPVEPPPPPPLPVAVEPTKCPEPKECPVCPPPPHLPPPHEAFAAHPEKEHAAHEGHGIGQFSIIPQYSFVTQKATESATGAEVSATSELAYGVELGWDKEWNESFSTLLTYAFTQMRSSEKNDNGNAIFDNTTISRAELTLFNKFGSHVRAGFGAAYGDHVFMENLAESPRNVMLYRVAFLNPLLAAEIKAFETESLEMQIALKIAMLPAQTGSGHDLKAGTEYGAQIALIQKFRSWSLLYAVAYAAEDQTRTDASETRNELALKLGVLF